MLIALKEWGRATFLMGVAIAEINQPWLVNIGILYHSGYFHEVVDD